MESPSSICLFSFHALVVKLVKDEKANRSKGLAFIQYTSQEDALLAVDNMDHKVIPAPIFPLLQEIVCLEGSSPFSSSVF